MYEVAEVLRFKFIGKWMKAIRYTERKEDHQVMSGRVRCSPWSRVNWSVRSSHPLFQATHKNKGTRLVYNIAAIIGAQREIILLCVCVCVSWDIAELSRNGVDVKKGKFCKLVPVVGESYIHVGGVI